MEDLESGNFNKNSLLYSALKNKVTSTVICGRQYCCFKVTGGLNVFELKLKVILNRHILVRAINMNRTYFFVLFFYTEIGCSSVSIIYAGATTLTGTHQDTLQWPKQWRWGPQQRLHRCVWRSAPGKEPAPADSWLHRCGRFPGSRNLRRRCSRACLTGTSWSSAVPGEEKALNLDGTVRKNNLHPSPATKHYLFQPFRCT